jgi:hypothetical protein
MKIRALSAILCCITGPLWTKKGYQRALPLKPLARASALSHSSHTPGRSRCPFLSESTINGSLYPQGPQEALSPGNTA